jgi:hypothetical protein
LLARQAELNATLDLDKGEREVAPPVGGEGGVKANGNADVESDERATAVAACSHPREYNRRTPDGRADWSRISDTYSERLKSIRTVRTRSKAKSLPASLRWLRLS